MGESILFPVEDWLFSAVKLGSSLALQSLRSMGSSKYQEALAIYRCLSSRFKSTSPKGGLGVTTAKLDYRNLDHDNPLSNQKKSDLEEFHWPTVMLMLNNLSEGYGDAALARSTIPDDTQNPDGDTLLLCASRAGQHQVVKKLLDLGANANKTNSRGENALHFLACFDEQEVIDVAERLFKANVDCTAEARSSSIVCDFEQNPTSPGCPMIRAVVMDKPKILEILFRLEAKYERHPSARQQKMKERNLRKMLALACRQNNIEVLEVIASERPAIMESNINSVGFWIDDHRYSLSALAINGCVSDRGSSGYNIPEVFWRRHIHGAAYLDNLRKVLRFLHLAGVDYNVTTCGGDRNALFFAIRHGRADAVEILLEDYNSDQIFESFGVEPDSSTDVVELGPQATRAQSPNHRQKQALVDAIELSISQGHQEIFRTLLRTRNGEALKMGIEYPVFYMNVKTWRAPSYEKPWSFIFTEPEDVRPYFPSNVPSKVYRYDEVWKPLFRARSEDHLHVSDGRLNYALLYMVVVAKSLHRDIQLA